MAGLVPATHAHLMAPQFRGTTAVRPEPRAFMGRRDKPGDDGQK